MKNTIKLMAVLLLFLTGCSSVQQLNENITQPTLKKEPKLIYPIPAQQKNIMGTTTVMFIISKEGSVLKTRIQKSSGSNVLDLAAENYCKKLEFFPAKENGMPISSTMKWDVKFNLEDLSAELDNKIHKVKNLYSEIENSKGAKRQSLERELLAVHDNYIKNLKDGLKINEYLYAVVQPNIKEEWRLITEQHPLTFLLYHDFMNRFGDFDSLSMVKEKMKMALKQDLQFLNQPYNFTSTAGSENKALIIQKIKRLIESNYPDIDLHNFDLKTENQNNIS